jgi:hypothetical protein
MVTRAKSFQVTHVDPLFVLSVLSLSIFAYNSPVQASSGAYDSGREHGCDDARISNPSDRYINQPERGPSFHTSAFMDGYNAGFNECSGSSSSDGNNGNDRDSESGGKPYCDEVEREVGVTCWDRKDYSEDTGLYPCRDGSYEENWQDCD